MKRSSLYAIPVLLASLLLTSGAWAFGLKDVIQMNRDGIPDSLIIQKIEYSGKVFHLDADDFRRLKAAGVSDDVVSAMLVTEDRDDGFYGPPYYYPRRPYYRPYYSPYYPRVVVGLGFGYYGHPYGYYPHGPHGGFSPWSYPYTGHGMFGFGYGHSGFRHHR